MRHRRTLWQSRLGGIVLAMLLLGGYVPVGYMPAEGAPFQVELCPGASPLPAMGDATDMSDMSPDMPMEMPAGAARHAHHHAAGHDHVCPFGSAPGAGPLASLSLFSPPSLPSPDYPAPSTRVLDRRPLLSPQARGPPLRVI